MYHIKRKNGAILDVFVCQILKKSSSHYASFSAMVSPIHSATNEDLFKKRHSNQSGHYGNKDNFCYKHREAITVHAS